MTWRPDWRTLGAGALGGAFGALPVLVIDHKLWDATAAGWAQAIGTIAAFFAVIWQTGAAERFKDAERREVANVAADAINNSYEALRPVFDWTEGEGSFANEFEKLIFYFGAHEDDTMVKLLDLPISTWPKLALYSKARAYQHSIALLGRDLDASVEGLVPTPKTRLRAMDVKAAKQAFDEVVRGF
jgi:hypothetical protein